MISVQYWTELHKIFMIYVPCSSSENYLPVGKIVLQQMRCPPQVYVAQLGPSFETYTPSNSKKRLQTRQSATKKIKHLIKDDQLRKEYSTSRSNLPSKRLVLF